MSLTESDEFYLSYGKAMAAWADVEGALCDWFVRAIEPDHLKEVNAKGIFYSARSFSGRADMLKAAANSTNLTSDQKTFVRKAIKRASDYNKLRAKLAHRVTVMSGLQGAPGLSTYLREGDDTFGMREFLPSISRDDIENATVHFDALRWIILVVDISGGITPEEGRQLIDRLPKEAHLPVDNHLIEEVYES